MLARLWSWLRVLFLLGLLVVAAAPDMLGRLWSWLRAFAVMFLVGGVRAYQTFIRPILPPLCRFQPSCSEYFIQAVHKYGPLRGACKGVGRICRCNPWHPGGFDPP